MACLGFRDRFFEVVTSVSLPREYKRREKSNGILFLNLNWDFITFF